MSSCAGTGARPLTVWCMPWPQVLHDSVDVVSCASFPSHPCALSPPVRCSAVFLLLLYRTECGSVGPLYCIRTALQYYNNHSSLEQCHHLHLGVHLFLFFFCPHCLVWPRSHCSLRPGPTARSSLVPWPSRCHPYGTAALGDNRPLFNHMGNKQSLGHSK